MQEAQFAVTGPDVDRRTQADHRTTSPPHWHWLRAVLDEIDYGVLLVADDDRVLHANHWARRQLASCWPLQVEDGRLVIRHVPNGQRLRAAIGNAQRGGRRALITLDAGSGAEQTRVAVVPVGQGSSVAGETAVLLVFGKPALCSELALDNFAREADLTTAEGKVLAGLCRGRHPSAIAQEQGVAMSTVRTQIAAIRAKTGARSMRGLLQQLAGLPPLMGVLGREDGAPVH